MKCNPLLLLHILLIPMLGCEYQDSIGGVEDTSRRYFFEIEYLRYAWSYELSGLVVDTYGRVYSYDHTHFEFPFSPDSLYSEQGLDNKYTFRRAVDTLPYTMFRDYLTMVPAAVEGNLKGDGWATSDVGTTSYITYVPTDGGKYRRVVLGTTGEQNQTSSSPEARRIVQWLDSLDSLY